MDRFAENRVRTRVFRLLLALVIASAIAFGSVVRSEAGQAYVSEPGSPTGSGPTGPGTGGDPDVPTAGVLKLRPGMDRYPAMTEGGVGDVASAPGIRSMWTIRLRFVALGMRAYLLRF